MEILREKVRFAVSSTVLTILASVSIGCNSTKQSGSTVKDHISNNAFDNSFKLEAKRYSGDKSCYCQLKFLSPTFLSKVVLHYSESNQTTVKEVDYSKTVFDIKSALGEITFIPDEPNWVNSSSRNNYWTNGLIFAEMNYFGPDYNKKGHIVTVPTNGGDGRLEIRSAPESVRNKLKTFLDEVCNPSNLSHEDLIQQCLRD